MKVVCAGDPETTPLLEVSGENPATVSGLDWEGNWGREEGEGGQERV